MDSCVSHHHHVSKITVMKWIVLSVIIICQQVICCEMDSCVSHHHHVSKLTVVKWIALSVIIIKVIFFFMSQIKIY